MAFTLPAPRLSRFLRSAVGADGQALEVSIVLSPGIDLSTLSHDSDQTIGAACVRDATGEVVPIGRLGEVGYSELRRDLEASACFVVRQVAGTQGISVEHGTAGCSCDLHVPSRGD
ncbi:MAG: hypothetical protein JW940_33150 [Polyangiaceae bacterium]|nr:hypothetical protein [Polyangiaceae bacterium]